jgi:hypothetical protein
MMYSAPQNFYRNKPDRRTTVMEDLAALGIVVMTGLS